MRIFYDYQIFESQVYGGISRYFYELINGIVKRPGVSYNLPIEYSSNHYLQNLKEETRKLKGTSNFYSDFLWGVEFPGKWKMYQAYHKLFPNIQRRNQALNISALKKNDFDIFHPTDLNDYFIPFCKRPFVITIHDLIDEIFPEYSFHVHSSYRTSVKEKLIAKASGIIAVSECTKKDIIKRFNVDPDKIKVIYHGVSDLKADGVGEPINDGTYLLYVGKRTHYKNFYFLLQCLQPFLLDDPALKVVCAGSDFTPKEQAYIADLKLSKSIVCVNAEDAKLRNLYRHALAFVYPTLYEGFGMPILEAFGNGCPVIVSNTSSLPEVAGDAALYFNPKDIDSIRSSISRILSDLPLRNELRSKGRERIKAFSWNNTVDETLKYYSSLIK